MSRLKTSERNSLIEDFRAGNINKDYEVIQSKTAKGKYTIRKRSKPLSEEELSQMTKEKEDEPIEVDVNDPEPSSKKKSKIKITNKADPNVLFLQNMLSTTLMKRIDDLEFWKNKTKMKKQLKKQNKKMAEDYEVVEEIVDEEEKPKAPPQQEQKYYEPPPQQVEEEQEETMDYDALYGSRINYANFGF